MRSASCSSRRRTVASMSLCPASVSRTETARRDAGDGALSTRPVCSARAMRWETAPAVIRVRRVISRVVSS
jgi:hypothetical protein